MNLDVKKIAAFHCNQTNPISVSDYGVLLTAKNCTAKVMSIIVAMYCGFVMTKEEYKKRWHEFMGNTEEDKKEFINKLRMSIAQQHSSNIERMNLSNTNITRENLEKQIEELKKEIALQKNTNTQNKERNTRNSKIIAGFEKTIKEQIVMLNTESQNIKHKDIEINMLNREIKLKDNVTDGINRELRYKDDLIEQLRMQINSINSINS